MHFVAVKSEEGSAANFRSRDVLVGHRRLAEFGVIAPQGRSHVKPLITY
jgi:hypothetical protein